MTSKYQITIPKEIRDSYRICQKTFLKIQRVSEHRFDRY
ncbi:AbrB/MazE/SpoVT family DNA-binding domain-containing protein [Leptospira ilyithenensis]|nr:AbrB/MazE/SpoVT family DNA-binding domain-containing protein [Leptospira ilyithenensis]